MERILLTIFMLAVTTCSVSSVKLMADINMNGVVGVIEFAPSGGDVVVNLTIPNSIPTGGVNVDIRSSWMNYDVEDKCSDEIIGSSILDTQLAEWDVSTTTSFRINGKEINDLEGRTILISNSQTRACASIWNPDGNYHTAVATFSGQMVGSVYFRRSDGDDEQTLVQSNFGWNGAHGDLQWKITDQIDNCDDTQKLSYAEIYDPGNSGGTPVGSLTRSLGLPLAGTSKNSRIKKSYSGHHLSLTDSGNGVIDKFIIVFDSSDSAKAACGRIRSIQPMKATTFFSHEGIHGHISFTQSSPFDMTKTSVSLHGLNSGAKGYHVHLFPVPIQTEKDQPLCSPDVVAGHYNPYAITTFPAPTVGTDDQYEIGDLSSKYGTLSGLSSLNENYTDWNLPLFGTHSILGRSLVIHRDDDTNSRWVCSNIEPEDAVAAGVAIFKYPVYGYIYFTQAQGSPDSDTSIFSHLSSLDGAPGAPSSSHKWYIHTDEVGDDMMADGASRCASTKSVFNPMDGESCTPQNAATKCKLGDMSGKLGNIDFGTYPQAKNFFTDVFLPLADKNSILGKSVVIMDQSGTSVLACATIQPIRKPMLKADLSLGTVSFTQQPGFGQRPTTVSLDFDIGKHRIQIYSLPPIDGKSKCSDLGAVYNPLEVSGSPTTDSTQDQYKVGDITRGTQKWMDLNLPLTGRTSIRHRAVAVLNSKSEMVTCGIIQDPFSRSFNGYQVAAKATFSDPLMGSIDLFQTLYEDGTTTDTSVVVNLSNKDNAKTPNHNWHVHIKTVSGDSNAETGRCSSTGSHYDPFNTIVGAAKQYYSQQCSKMDPLRCELGDQANKLGAYSLGSGRAVFTDIDLPLNGKYKVQGRSIVVHAENKGAPRYSCADINPVIAIAALVEFVTPQTLDLQEAARLYANAINAPEENVVVQFISSSGDKTTVHVHFLGFSREIFLSKFKIYFKVKSTRDKFGKYAPVSAPVTIGDAGSKADGVAISTVLLLVTLVMNAVFFHF